MNTCLIHAREFIILHKWIPEKWLSDGNYNRLSGTIFISNLQDFTWIYDIQNSDKIFLSHPHRLKRFLEMKKKKKNKNHLNLAKH